MEPDNKPITQENEPPHPTTPHKHKLLLALIIGLVLAVTTFALFNKPSTKEPITADPPQATVSITKQGFVPATLSVKPGTVVTWVNEDKNPHRIASNPYPSHTDLPGLDSNAPIGPTGTYQYTFKDTGTFGYHDHYSPTTNGSVIVGE